MRYATALGRNPADTYRQIDMAGRTAEASGHALVGLLYEELGHALRAAGYAAESHQYAIRAEKVSRSMAILFALEAGLDFEAGGDIARTLSRLYSGARQTVADASLGYEAKPFTDIADSMDEIAAAWRSVGN